MTHDATLPPSPQGGWSQSVVTLSHALVVPPAKARKRVLNTGVFDSEGAFCHHAALWRRDECITLPPKPAAAKQKLKGTWLWGGMLYHHFGHFQVESTARLWAIKRFASEIEGIVFTPRDVKAGAELAPYQVEYFRHLIGDVPIKILTKPTEVEELVVPGQGFGMGRIAGGTRVFRRFIDSQFAKDVPSEGSKKLFISRSKQGLDKGGFVGEAVLDARMEAAGYSVFWPEEHSVTEQIAHYKAASHVVALDGSALHLFAMVGKKSQAVALILRREKIASRSLRRHLHRFMAREPLVIKALQDGDLVQDSKKRLISELDFDAIGRALKRGGFVARKHPWGPLEEGET